MKALLDTNIIIHRESGRIINYEIGQLYYWLNKLKYDKYVHSITVDEIEKYKNEEVVNTFSIKLDSYNKVRHILPFSERVKKVSENVDKNENDINDTHLLNEIYEGRLDILISEDKKIRVKAKMLDIEKRIFTIQSFLEKAISENPELVDYSVLAVKKVEFGDVNLQDSFFDSFREDYEEFDSWFKKKFDKACYVCYSKNNLTAFLYIKVEGEKEVYSDIKPQFEKRKRLKIGTLKVVSNGYKIGERFLKIVFDNAIQYKVEEIYVTIFDKRPEQRQLMDMLKVWGFTEHGIKSTQNGNEIVLVRDFKRPKTPNILAPKLTFPYISWNAEKYIIAIKHEYHTELFPDSINTKEDKLKYVDNEPHRNRIGKVYISHSKSRVLKRGDVVIIYRIGEQKPKRYSSTVTSICIVEDTIDNFGSFEDFYKACHRRTFIDRKTLEKEWWNKYTNLKPFVIKLLYVDSFPTPKPNLNNLVNIGVIPDIKNMGRGFIPLNEEQFKNLIKFAYKIK